MKWRSKRIADSEKNPHHLRCALCAEKAFSLIEVLTALIILAFISSSVLVVINRCTESVADSVLRMQAFETARENMEQLLAGDSVAETVEYGTSEKFPAVQWETRVELFSEPISSAMWVKGVCSADYTDTAGQKKSVELTHWLTDLTDEQMLKITEDKEDKEQLLAEQIIETAEDAAEYADVDEETIQQWVDNGMRTTKDGSYFKYELDLYKTTGGNPTVEQRTRAAEIYARVLVAAGEQPPSTGQPEPEAEPEAKPERDPKDMTFEELLEFIREFFK